MTELRQERPLLVVTNPSWSFDQDKFEPADFFAEAKITEDSVRVLRARFRRFASSDRQNDGSVSLTLRDFRRLNQHYAICRAEHEENFFRAMGRNSRQRLSFDEFLLGCSAASPATPHILNSLTGFVRARYIFDYYNTSRSGTLEFEELACLLGDARRQNGEETQLPQRQVVEVAQELGEVSAVTLQVLSGSRALCDVRVSRRWTGQRVRREIAKELKVPVEGQKLTVGAQDFPETKVLEDILRPEQTSVDVDAALNWDHWPVELAEPLASDGLASVERLVHVPFEAFYKALVAEQLRGMSRLFRFRRQLFHTSKSGNLTTALVGGA